MRPTNSSTPPMSIKQQPATPPHNQSQTLDQNSTQPPMSTDPTPTHIASLTSSYPNSTTPLLSANNSNQSLNASHSSASPDPISIDMPSHTTSSNASGLQNPSPSNLPLDSVPSNQTQDHIFNGKSSNSVSDVTPPTPNPDIFPLTQNLTSKQSSQTTKNPGNFTAAPTMCDPLITPTSTCAQSTPIAQKQKLLPICTNPPIIPIPNDQFTTSSFLKPLSAPTPTNTLLTPISSIPLGVVSQTSSSPSPNNPKDEKTPTKPVQTLTSISTTPTTFISPNSPPTPTSTKLPTFTVSVLPTMPISNHQQITPIYSNLLLTHPKTDAPLINISKDQLSNPLLTTISTNPLAPSISTNSPSTPTHPSPPPTPISTYPPSTPIHPNPPPTSISIKLPSSTIPTNPPPTPISTNLSTTPIFSNPLSHLQPNTPHLKPPTPISTIPPQCTTTSFKPLLNPAKSSRAPSPNTPEIQVINEETNDSRVSLEVESNDGDIKVPQELATFPRTRFKPRNPYPSFKRAKVRVSK
ncbi:hypothetical protein RRG08_015789 [Elysia crispata]|uniref:Uncharacterized protein n=1 Tax=Elysia crispata TaxID=231223 RepID=A0AAE0YLF6_9GAST|nr:hypothetical protein RRG08_015789 [Elysia crispata]